MVLKIKEYPFYEIEEKVGELENDFNPGYPFVSKLWLKTINDSQMGDLYLLVIYENDNPVSYFPLFIKAFIGYKMFLRAPATPYLGPVFKEERTEKQSRIIHRRNRYIQYYLDYINNNYYSGHCFLPPDFVDIREFLWKGWASLVRYTYINDLRDMDNLWDRFRSKMRNKIKRVEKEEIVVETSRDIKVLKEIMDETYNIRDKSDPLNAKFYQSLRNNILSTDMGRLYYLRHPSAKEIGVRVVLVYKDSAYDILAGYRRDENVSFSGMNEYFVWKIFQDLSGKVDNFDFTGANIRSIAHFKSGFEGELVPFYQVSLKRRFSNTLNHCVNIFNR
jgi:hypothetical protein